MTIAIVSEPEEAPEEASCLDPSGPGARALHTFGRGRTVASYSRYEGDGESSYWAVLYEPALGTFEHVAYSSDRSRGPSWEGRAVVDAPDELVRAYADEEAGRAAAAEEQRQAAEAAQAAINARLRWETPRLGSRIVVRRGRKIPLGRSGTVLSAGQGTYGPWLRVDWADKSGLGRDSHVFIVPHNVEVISQADQAEPPRPPDWPSRT